MLALSRLMQYAVLLLIGLLGWAVSSCAEDFDESIPNRSVLQTLPLVPLDKPTVALGRQVFYLPASDELSLEHALSSLKWRAYSSEIVNFGYTDKRYWLAFRFASVSAAEQRLLAIGYPLLDQIDIYIFADHGNSHMRLGDHLPFAERPIAHRHFLVPLAASATPVTVVMRIASVSSMQVPLTVITEQALLEQDQQAQVGQGIYFGIMLAMLFYNLFLYFSIRDDNYLFYVASVICVALVQATLRGYSYQFLWPGSPVIQHLHMPIIVSLSGAFVAFFSIGFLNLSARSTWLYRLVQSLAWVLVVNAMLSPMLGYLFAVRVGVGVTTLYAVAGTVAGIYAWRQGFRPAGYFCAAYFALFAGTLVIALNKFGFLPRNFFTENAQEIGSIAEVLLLSFALADRINELRRQKDQAQHQARLELEQKVDERTAKLRDAMEALAAVNTKLSLQMREDGLTGALNRKAFDDILAKQIHLSNVADSTLCLVLLDVDHFKQFNDAHGHLVGDDCLKHVIAQVQASMQRSADQVFRYGGEEFAVLLLGASKSAAQNVAERLRERVENAPLQYGCEFLKVTVSLGVACSSELDILTSKALISLADQRLYQAKAAGRNRVVA